MTILTQIGGIVYLLYLLLLKKVTIKSLQKRVGLFVFLYLLTTFLLVPLVAPILGRERVQETEIIKAHAGFTKLFNRNYVKPELNRVLKQASVSLNNKYPGIKIVYLDANFPFIDKFPLLPHLSHNDGKKIDLSLIYKDKKGNITNKKPSNSGYGIYVHPKNTEFNQTKRCKKQGYWQYDFPKYLTFGQTNKGLQFSEVATKHLINSLIKQPTVGKIFIEPHLKNRMSLNHPKIRFHGCRAVRHDDHIHIQLR